MSQPDDKLSIEEALSSASDTRILEISPHALKKTPEIFRAQFHELPAVIVADTNTFAAGGQRLLDMFRQAAHPCLEPFIYSDPNLYAEDKYVAQLEENLKAHEAIPIAVGAGTINDLTKLAAHRQNRPYVCVATAASMDGYTAFGASITHK